MGHPSSLPFPLSTRWRGALQIALTVGGIALLYLVLFRQSPLPVLAIGILVLAFKINRWLLLPAVVIAALLLALAVGIFSPDLRSVAHWISTNTDANTTLAADHPGAIVLLAQRPIIAATIMDRAFFIQYAPDVVVLRGDQPDPLVAWENFSTTYQQMFTSERGGYHVYQRVVNFTPLPPQWRPVDLLYNQYLPNRHDLRLVGVSVADSAVAGDLVRVILTWDLRYPSVVRIIVRVSLVDMNGTVIASSADEYTPEAGLALWKAGSVTTYHLLPLPGEVRTGELELRIGVTVGEGDLGEHVIQRIIILP